MSLNELIAFAPSTDLDRSRRFYEGILGLVVTEHSRFAVAFDVGGTMAPSGARVAWFEDPDLDWIQARTSRPGRAAAARGR